MLKTNFIEKFNTFLIADYRSNNDRILIFANQACRGILENNSFDILCDGTFKFCVKPFYQLYSLHVDFGSTNKYTNIAPVIFALLPNKTRKTYEIMFQLLKSQLPNWNPKSFILDYEVAAMQAITNIFPETPINGCYFHFSKSLWSKAKGLGITKLTLNRKHIKRCTALAHLPPQATDDGWLYVMSRCPKDKKLAQFNDYFVETWLKENAFFANKWCCYNRQHRTTNMVENWHSIINKKIKCKPSSIAHYLTILEKEANYYEALILGRTNIIERKEDTCQIEENNINHVIEQYVKGEITIDLCVELLLV